MKQFKPMKQYLKFNILWKSFIAFITLLSFYLALLPQLTSIESPVVGSIATVFSSIVLFVFFVLAVRHFIIGELQGGTASYNRVLVLIEKKHDESFPYCESVRSSIRQFVNAHQGADYFERTLSDENNWHLSTKRIFKDGMDEFCANPDIYGTAIAVFPSEEAIYFSPDQTKPWLEAIQQQNQRLICIDSGYKLYRQPLLNNIVLARCEHQAAAKKIIRAIHEKLLPQITQSSIQFVLTDCVSINTAVNIRRQEYGKLITLLTAHMSRVEDDGLKELSVFYKTIEELLIKTEDRLWRGIAKDFAKNGTSSYSKKLSLHGCEWSKNGVRKAMLDHVPALEVLHDTHIIYLCENDDVGLGIVEAYAEKSDSRSSFNSRISIVAFDGTEEFTEMAESKNINAVTYAVDYEDLKNNIDRIVQSTSDFKPTIGGNIKVWTHDPDSN